MTKDGFLIPNQEIQCKCVESKVETDRPHYGRPAISPFRKGQASTIGIAMRKALLGEIEGTGVTRAKSEKINCEYSTITGIRETIHDTSVNSKEIALRGNFRDIQEACIYVTGPKEVTAGDISLPSNVEVVDHLQYIATITKPVSIRTNLRLEKGCGYRISDPKYEDGESRVDAVSMSVRSVNHSIHPFENAERMREILFLEVWTNGSPTPCEVSNEASKKLIDLFNPFLNVEKMVPSKGNDNPYDVAIQSFCSGTNDLAKEITLRNTFIDQLELPSRVYNCLKRANVNTITDLLNYTREDLRKINNSGKKSVDRVSEALWERSSIKLPSKSKKG
uniref:RNA polymerase alpha subunit n=1 Tax=Schizaea fistulosa TaxID=292911 RepID=UPI002115112F|nr:RNA polymerase alpha subunit [Schizaea fistulosa]UTJ90241.1 RNA polymerase alpha subunit [Schizaea fistulosa]